MVKRYSVFFIVIFFVICLKLCFAQQSTDSLKVLTFNIYGAPNSAWPTRLGMILDELEQIQPDIIGFQEVVETPGTGGIDNTAKIIADSLMKRTGVQYDFYWNRTHFSWSTFDEGVAILTKHIIIENDYFDLPPGIFNRKVVMARILTPFGIIDFFNTHLSYGDQQPVRNEQVIALKSFITQKSVDSIATISLVTGDFNSGPDSESIQMMVQQDSTGVLYLDSWNVINPGTPGYTVPSDAPTNRIDYVFLKDGQFGEILGSNLVLKTHNNQNLYPSDHIGVLSKFGTSIHNAQLQILTPLAGDEISGNINITWSVNSQIEPMNIFIYVSNDKGNTWTELWSGLSASNTYQWDTNSFPDGTKYLLRLAAVGDSSFSYSQNSSTFIVNNPGNATPEIEILKPGMGQIISDQFTIEWSAADADGDTLSIDLEVSYDDGASWSGLAQNLLNDGSYLWNTLNFPNSPFYRIKLLVSDDSIQVEEISEQFSLQNIRTLLPDSLFIHISGEGDGIINSSVYDSSQITDHLYQIIFDDTSFQNTVYHVYDTNSYTFKVQNATELDGVTEGPSFDGMRLTIFNYPQALVDQENTNWTIGNTDLEHTISIPELNIGGNLYTGYPYAADYKITIYDHIVDTSSTHLGAPAIPMKFKVENISENRQIKIIFIEQDFNNTISGFDELYLLENDSISNPLLSWLIYFGGNEPFTNPLPGDEFVFSTLKPFSNKDVIEFSTVYHILSFNDKKSIINDYKLHQNYPNPFNQETTIRYQLPTNNFVTIDIYNISGQRIIQLANKKQKAGNHKIIWDGKNNSGKQVSSGIYFYRFKAGNFIKNRKMILLR